MRGSPEIRDEAAFRRNEMDVSGGRGQAVIFYEVMDQIWLMPAKYSTSSADSRKAAIKSSKF